MKAKIHYYDIGDYLSREDKLLDRSLYNQIIAHKRKVLIGKGNISHKQAIEKAEKEFEIYRKREMDMLESDFDKEMKKIRENNQY